MNITELKRELSNKQRTVADLVRFIGKRSDSHPSYSIFLGAGASVTSGISSGTNLVDSWRKELYEFLSNNEYNDTPQSNETIGEAKERAKIAAIEYLTNKHGGWYNASNEYASLFERKFDLPIQRRRFVENLVDNKLPSIGYLYLISLINNRYFNSVFTTNFDDLINEAFYQFSNIRPLVCAHDSSINSISVLADRPKIIKLHGDYLFDDIKNTLRETESLEANTKDKFIEFSKEYGMIIVGYAGHDRSIIDVINYLLKQDEYLKNGLYWCIRKGDEVSQEVRKILWKERAYFIEIDGFDELFAEINHSLNCKISLHDKDTNSKRDESIKNFIADDFNLSTKNTFIKRELEKLKELNKNRDFSIQLQELTSTNISSQEELRSLLYIDNQMRNKNFDEADKKIEECLSSISDKKDKEKYILRQVAIFKLKKNNDLAIKKIEELILMDPYNASYITKKGDLITDFKDKIDYLKSCESKFNYNYSFNNNFAFECIKWHQNYEDNKNNTPKPSIEIDSILTTLNKSISLDKSLDNIAWEIKFNCLELSKKQNKANKELSEKVQKEIENLVREGSSINKTHSTVLKIKKKVILSQENFSNAKTYVEELLAIIPTSSIEQKETIIEILCSTLFLIMNFKELGGYKELCLYFFSENMDKYEFSTNYNFLIFYANFCISMEKNIEKSNEIIKQLYELPTSHEIVDSITAIALIDTKNIEELENYIDKVKDKLTLEEYFECLSEIESAKGDFIKAITLIDKAHENNHSAHTYIMKKSFLYLKNNNFTSARDFILKHINNKNFSAEQRAICKINLETANKNLDGINKESRIELLNISGHNFTPAMTACALSLLDDRQALSHIKDIIEKNFIWYFKFLSWPAINNELKEQIRKSFSLKFPVLEYSDQISA